MNRFARLALVLAGMFCLSLDAVAQSSNMFFPADTVEQRLKHDLFDVTDSRDTRFKGDRTQRAVLTFLDSTIMAVKWAKAAEGGEEFNNQPRYEIAAYELQKLFLDPESYVVPPTVGRMIPLAWYQQFDEDVSPTFRNIPAVLVVLQYWLANVSDEGVFDRDRFRADSVYARHLGNLNIFTYLARHSDANTGNVLLSQDATYPRLYAVDNGVAFASDESNRGDDWQHLRLDRLPRGTVDRLRALRPEDLEHALGVVAQFELRDGAWVSVEPTANLEPGRGIRRTDTVVQLGLTTREIRGVYSRLERILDLVDSGRIAMF